MSKHLSNPCYQAMRKVCEEYGFDHTVEHRSKHPEIVVYAGAHVVRCTFAGTTANWRAADDSKTKLRRMIEQALAQSPLPTIKVLDREIVKVEMNGQRVITLRQIDDVHERPEGTARRQFNANRQRFTEGRDYLKMSANEFRTRFPGLLSDRATEDLTLFTERGYGKIVKGWNDDLAWALHDAMQDAYFLMRAVAGAVQTGALSEADWKRIGGIIKSVVVKQTEDMRAGAELCLEEVARLGQEIAAVRSAPVVPSFDFASTVTSRDMMDMAGIPQAGRVRGTTGGVITRAMKDYCLARGLPARKTPQDIDPDCRWRFPRSAAIEWLNGPSLGKEVIRNHIAIAQRRARKPGQGVLTFPTEMRA